jgi:hypothetical protein
MIEVSLRALQRFSFDVSVALRAVLRAVPFVRAAAMTVKLAHVTLRTSGSNGMRSMIGSAAGKSAMNETPMFYRGASTSSSSAAKPQGIGCPAKCRLGLAAGGAVKEHAG